MTARTRRFATRMGYVVAGALLLISPTAQAKAHASKSVKVLYAGSMTNVMENAIGPQVQHALGITLAGEGAGSAELAHFIQSGQKKADLFISASPSVIQDDLMGTQNHNLARWYVTLAGDSLVIAYNPKSRFSSQLRAAARGNTPWYSVLEKPGFRLGRTDPVLDPKGAYTLVMMTMAEKFYHQRGLESAILGSAENNAQVFPEEDLLARLGSGQLDAVIAYRHEAVEWHMPYISLPDAINLGSAKYAKQYAATKVRIGGKLKSGSLVEFALTIPVTATNSSGAVAVARDLLAGPAHRLILREGFTPIPIHVSGNMDSVPAALRTWLTAVHPSS